MLVIRRLVSALRHGRAGGYGCHVLGLPRRLLLRDRRAGRKAESHPCRVGEVQPVSDLLEHGKVLDLADASFEVAYLSLVSFPKRSRSGSGSPRRALAQG